VRRSSRSTSLAFLTVLALLAGIFASLAGGAIQAAPTLAQSTLNCNPSPATPVSSPVAASPEAPVAPAAGALTKVTIGYVNASVFAPIFVAKERGFFAEQGIDADLKPLPGGSDLITLTATGSFDVAMGGAGPAFWNAEALGLPIVAIAPGHMEGNPVATPLMISKANCDSGAIKSVADLKGKKVSVNARGATEYWLAAALGTAGLTLNDISLQTLGFPDAVAALQSGAIDAAMVGEPLATSAEQKGIAVRLATDFPVQDVQPTALFGNKNWLKDHPDAAAGIVTAYLEACRELMNGGFDNPTDLGIIEQYTGVPAALVKSAVRPIYEVDGAFSTDGLQKMQAFFRERGQLEYDKDLDPATVIDTTYVDAALSKLGPAKK
jgi:NitT/TauT family transport system substrate-binding protein